MRTLLKSFLPALLLASLAAAQAVSPGVVVSYSFDDGNVATGPDTFRVFNYAKGNVNLTTTYCRSGYRSVELHDEADDKDFPELQGYFPLRRKGQLFAHFAFMTTAPNEPLNMALAGPEWFTWRQYIESWLVCEQYYFVLLWQKSFDRAGRYALRMVERYQMLGVPTWLWRERAGDAAFYAQSYEEANRLYGESMKENMKNTSVLLKLSDVYFILGDLEKEQIYREKVYGTLSPNRF